MDAVERSAASVEEAVESALAELGLTEQQAHIEIVQEPSRGLLGLHSSPAVVRVRARDEAGTFQPSSGRSGGSVDVRRPAARPGRR
jgi:predicted RNA-binding protein Jag